MKMTITHTEFEKKLLACGIDPIAVRSFRPRERTFDQVADGKPVETLTVHPLVTVSTNKNNVNNGYATDGGAIGAVPQQYPASAIEEEQRNNWPASDGCAIDAAPKEIAAAATEDKLTTYEPAPLLATQDDEIGKDGPPSADGGSWADEVGASAETMPAPFYLKVDLFDNGAGKPGKKKGNRYKVKIHLAFEDGGEQFSYLGAFHPVTRGFRHNVPEGFENDPFYVETDHTLDKSNLSEAAWHIKPLGAKFKDADNKVIIYTAAIVFWDASEQHPTILLSLQGWGCEVTLDQRPRGNRAGNNLLAYGIWLNPQMRTEREVFDNKKGGKTLVETIRLQKMGLK